MYTVKSRIEGSNPSLSANSPARQRVSGGADGKPRSFAGFAHPNPTESGYEGRHGSEVKNVKWQTWTPQLRDYAEFAREKGLQFNLYIRAETAGAPGTQISSSLAAAAARGEVNILPY